MVSLADQLVSNSQDVGRNVAQRTGPGPGSVVESEDDLETLRGLLNSVLDTHKVKLNPETLKHLSNKLQPCRRTL